MCISLFMYLTFTLEFYDSTCALMMQGLVTCACELAQAHAQEWQVNNTAPALSLKHLWPRIKKKKTFAWSSFSNLQTWRFSQTPKWQISCQELTHAKIAIYCRWILILWRSTVVEQKFPLVKFHKWGLAKRLGNLYIYTPHTCRAW